MARQDNPVELAQKLVSYLDSSNGETQPLFDAVDSLHRGPKAEDPPFDLDAFETHIEQMDAALNDAWDVLEEDDGDAPLMSETYIDWSGEMDDDPEFTDGTDAHSLVRTISTSLDDARRELENAQDIVAAADEVPTDELKGDYGAYETLADYTDYVHSQVQGMCEMADALEGEV